eukprot:6463873-Prorocentrum_lima.AAC.1
MALAPLPAPPTMVERLPSSDATGWRDSATGTLQRDASRHQPQLCRLRRTPWPWGLSLLCGTARPGTLC